MANAAINILGDGSIHDMCAVNGCLSEITVTRTQVGTYLLEGTLGLVPPPDGWGVVTNPMDKLTTRVSYDNGTLTLETLDDQGQPADIISKVTLHVRVNDAPPMTMPTLQPDLMALALAHYATFKSQADAQLQLLQDLLDIGEGSPEIEAQVLEWKRYRVALRQVSIQAQWPDAVEWPTPPTE